jgi:hypothetical protein
MPGLRAARLNATSQPRTIFCSLQRSTPLDTAVAHAQRLASGTGARTVERFRRDSEHFLFGPLYRAMLELSIAATGDKALAKPHRPIVRRARRRGRRHRRQRLWKN